MSIYYFLFFFFNDPATTEIYTLSLHDALRSIDIKAVGRAIINMGEAGGASTVTQQLAKLIFTLKERDERRQAQQSGTDRKSTRLNSSHVRISYAVFCLKKKKKKNTRNI